MCAGGTAGFRVRILDWSCDLTGSTLNLDYQLSSGPQGPVLSL